MMPADQIRVHCTNVIGLGATKLLQSLLPALELTKKAKKMEFFLPDRGALLEYAPGSSRTKVIIYHRFLPNSISRLAECLFPGSIFNDPVPVLILGDLPLRCSAPQVVFVQTPHLLRPEIFLWSLSGLKYAVARLIFRINAPRLRAVIVQTKVMKDRLIETYPILSGKVSIIPQPVPSWLENPDFQRKKREYSSESLLNLVYPAAYYPHKNHVLLGDVLNIVDGNWPISSLMLTIDPQIDPAPNIDWVRCVGELSSSEMLEAYRDTDALVFLSKEESYGFPLVEAMYLGLPIVCPDLPFARTLCGEGAIYFNPDNIRTLNLAILELKERLVSGWYPDWTIQMREIPKNWQETADKILDVCI
jgi:glycosyltransferase involved in cell wall biosynthesis